MIEAGQANAAQNHAGMSGGAIIPCGIIHPSWLPTDTAFALPITPCPVPGSGHGFTGTIEGAKNSIAVMSTVLTIFRMCLCITAPLCRGLSTFAGVTLLRCASPRLRRQCGDVGNPKRTAIIWKAVAVLLHANS
jgi:hypothetical protein